MNNEQLKQALLSSRPIIYSDPLLGDMEYDSVSAIIYRSKDGKIKVSAELLDKNRCVIIVLPDRVRYKE